MKNGILQVSLYGQKREEKEYRFVHKVLRTISPVTETITNPKLAAGKRMVKQKGSNGMEVAVFRQTIENLSLIHILQQAGSMVDGQRLRFDFNHFAPLQPEELAAIEKEVNDAILADYPVVTEELPIEEAKKQGAMALFCLLYTSGKIGPEQYFCWNCLIEFDDQQRAYQVDEDGNLVQYWQEQMMGGGDNDEKTE